MPELPEVETVKRGLASIVEGRLFTYVETRRGDLRVLFPEDFENRLRGRRVWKLWRRAKYILADLEGAVNSRLPSQWSIYSYAVYSPIDHSAHR